jgi:hypothetical protein
MGKKEKGREVRERESEKWGRNISGREKEREK